VLNNLEPNAGYRARLSYGGDVSFDGTLADQQGTSISLYAGWTWLGWPSLTAASVDSLTHALVDSTTLEGNDRIKSQTQFTSYIPGWGWFGDLDQFEPGKGYMVKLESANTLVSFGATPARRKLDDILFESQPTHVVNADQWQLTPSAFEHSMCVVAVVVVNGSVAEDGHVAAFIDGQLRGVARPSSYTAPIGSYKGYKSYNLMAYGHMDTEGAKLTFQYRHADGQISKLAATTTFAKDAFIGSVIDPYVMTHATVSPTLLLPSHSAFPTTGGTWVSLPHLDMCVVVGIAVVGTFALMLATTWWCSKKSVPRNAALQPPCPPL